MDMLELEIECSSCDATGIFRSYAEPVNEGVVCRECKGKGGIIFTYKLFAHRKLRTDIERVYFRARLDPNEKPRGTPVTYEGFLKGERPFLGIADSVLAMAERQRARTSG